MYILSYCVTIVAALHITCGERNPYYEALRKNPWQSIQRYVQVRPGAFLFYWFYYADGSSIGAENKPLIIWIQGGPGFAASGLANFAEIGPLTMDMKPRNHTWVKGRNVLLIDHPVGTGFSYATNKTLFAKNDRDVAMDLLRTIRKFYRENKSFRNTPTFIIGQSYGGKICPRLAYYLHMFIEKKKLRMNLKGIGVGSGWVDPKESSLVFPNFLYTMGVIDQHTYLESMNLTRKMCTYIDMQKYEMAKRLETMILRILVTEAGLMINFNHILQDSPYPALDKLAIKINKYVKPTLHHIVNQSLEWNYRSEEAYEALDDSFMVPSNKFLEMILNRTKLTVTVFNGNMDIVTPLAGASNWVHKLRWEGAEKFKTIKRTKIRGHNNGLYKVYKQLSLWSVFGSGHWVPEDNPVAMEQILEHITGDENKQKKQSTVLQN